MGADQIAELRPEIAEVFAAAEEAQDICASFTVSSDASLWLQITRSQINLYYPHDGEPSRFDSVRTSRLRIEDWEAGQFLTLGYPDDETPRSIATLVDDLFTQVVGAPADYHVDVELFTLGAP